MFRLSLHAYHFSFDSGIHSAVHSKIRAGNVRRVRTSDECHHRGDIISLSVALERGRGLLWHRPITRGGVQIRFDWSGLPVIDSNAPAPALSGQRLSKYLH